MPTIDRRVLALPFFVLPFLVLALAGLPATAVEVSTPATPVAATDKPQQRPEVATLADGRFVVVLEDGSSDSGIIDPPQNTDGRDGSREGIVARLFDRQGDPAGEPFVLNTTTDGAQVCPRVAADPTTGGFVVAWIDSPRGEEIVVRRFASDGQPSSDEIRIAPTGFPLYCGVGLAIVPDGTVVLAIREIELFSIVHVGPDNVPQVRTADPLPSTLVDADTRLLPRDDGGVVFVDRAGDEIQSARFDADGKIVEAGTGLGTAAAVAGALRHRPFEPDGVDMAFALAKDLGTTLRVVDADDLNGSPRTTQVAARADWVALAAYGYDLVLVAAKEGRAQGPFSEAGQLSVHRFDLFGDPVDEIAYLAVDHGSRWQSPVAASANAYGRLLVAWEDAGFLGQVAMAVFEIEPPTLTLTGDRFAVSVEWLDFAGQTGDGFPVPLSSDTGAFWFFDPANLELTVKVLDGRAINGHFWVFQGSLTNVAYSLTVTDRLTGAVYTFENPLGNFSSFGDVEALSGP